MKQRFDDESLKARAAPYAEAAFEYALKHREIDDWEFKLRLVAEVFLEDGGDSVMRFPKSKALEIVNQGLDALEVTPQQRNLVNEMVRNDELFLAPWVYNGFVETFTDVVNRGKRAPTAGFNAVPAGSNAIPAGPNEVKVASAAPLSDLQLHNLKDMLKTRFNARAEPQLEVDPGLVSGIKITIGDRVFDQTAKGHAARLKKQTAPR